jgi:hypothetical protein
MTTPLRRARAQASASQANTAAGLLGLYALLALVGALAQAGKVGHLSLERFPGRTVGWLAWWSLSGLFATVGSAAAIVIGTLLHHGPAAPDPAEEPAADDYR